jgi:hypothetical protein
MPTHASAEHLVLVPSVITPDPGEYVCPGCPSDYMDHEVEMPIGEAVCLACGSFLEIAA